MNPAACFRGSKAYGIFREALQKDGAYTWLVEKLDATDVTSGGPAETIGPITGTIAQHPVPVKAPRGIFKTRDGDFSSFLELFSARFTLPGSENLQVHTKRGKRVDK